MKTKIIIGSTADLTPNMLKHFEVIPLMVRFGDETFEDGVTITKDDFYARMAASEELPYTSQPTPAAFMDMYEKVTRDGSDAVMITVSSKLSGTFQSATIAAEEYEGKVFVVDSGTAAMGEGILAVYALKLAEEGMSGREIAEELETVRGKIQVVAVLDTLDNLVKGGRLSKVAGFAGSVLGIKPVAGISDGKISVLGKARGMKNGRNQLSKLIRHDGVDLSKPILMGYSGTDDTALKAYIEDCEEAWGIPVSRISYTQIGTVVGTHAGAGAVGVAYFKK